MNVAIPGGGIPSFRYDKCKILSRGERNRLVSCCRERRKQKTGKIASTRSRAEQSSLIARSSFFFSHFARQRSIVPRETISRLAGYRRARSRSSIRPSSYRFSIKIPVTRVFKYLRSTMIYNASIFCYGYEYDYLGWPLKDRTILNKSNFSNT